MSVIDILLSGKMLAAIFIFILFSIAVEIIGSKILHRLDNAGVTEWMFEKIYIPLLRAIGLMIFILLCYPVLFGLSDAPPLLDLLFAGRGRISTLMNILFVLPLAFSIIPVFGSVPALLLPVQAIAGSTLVFSWMQASVGVSNLHYLPSISVILVIVLFAIIAHALAKWVALHISDRVNQKLHINDAQKIVYRIVVLVAQLPVILIYTSGLGRQLL